jgi:glutamyl-tRNA reductase
MLLAGKPNEDVMQYLANTLMNRLLHGPTQALRHAAELADQELARTVARLLTEERDRH